MGGVLTFYLENLHLSPVSAVVQLHPQLHHLDAMDEMPKGRGLKNKKDDDERPNDAEARAIDVKIKGAEDGGAMLVGNLDLLKRMQEEKWKTFEWIDAEVSYQVESSAAIGTNRANMSCSRPRIHGTHMKTI